MIPIVNPFLKDPDYRCFGCSPKNAVGLQMEFFLDGDEVVTFWDPQDHFVGFNNILHGGVRATLIDEIAAWAVFMELDTMGYTTRLEVNYNEIIYTDKGKLIIRARVCEHGKKNARVEVKILSEAGKVLTTGEADYFIMPSPIARKRMAFPERSEFFEGDPPPLKSK